MLPSALNYSVFICTTEQPAGFSSIKHCFPQPSSAGGCCDRRKPLSGGRKPLQMSVIKGWDTFRNLSRSDHPLKLIGVTALRFPQPSRASICAWALIFISQQLSPIISHEPFSFRQKPFLSILRLQSLNCAGMRRGHSLTEQISCHVALDISDCKELLIAMIKDLCTFSILHFHHQIRACIELAHVKLRLTPHLSLSTTYGPSTSFCYLLPKTKSA